MPLKNKHYKILIYYQWRMNQKNLIKTYQVLMRNKLNYGSIIHNSTKSNIFKIIKSIKNTLRLPTENYISPNIN